jgi:hypothetical protein
MDMSDRAIPLVSILTPSLNQATWLPDNLHSVACQTYPRIEHIVMDGGSTDETIAWLESAGESVRWRSARDRGQADAINKAFAESRGDIIGWINSDDAYFDCEVIERVVAYFAAHPEIDVVFGHCVQTTADGHVIQVLWAPPFDERLMHVVNAYSQPAGFMRRSALSEPMLDDSFHFALDYELWLRLMSQGRRIGRLDRTLAIDRHQPERKSSTMKDVNDSDLQRLATMYAVDVTPGADAERSAFYRKQRLFGAPLIPAIHRGRLAFSAPRDFKRGLWRRQVGSRRSSWPEELR